MPNLTTRTAATTLPDTALTYAALSPFGTTDDRKIAIGDLRTVINNGNNTNVKNYGAKGDGIIKTDGAMTAGSAVLTSATGTFTAADVGKTIGIGSAGSYMTITISAATNATPCVITFTTSQVTAPSQLNGFRFVISGATGNTNVNGTRWLTNVSGSFGTGPFTANLCSDSQQITKINGNGTFGGTCTGRAPVTLTATIASYTSATQVTLSSAAVFTVSGQRYVYGTDDTAAIKTALAIGRASLYFPEGVYCVNDPTNATSFGSPAIHIKSRDVQIQGAGRGRTEFVCMSEYGPVIAADASLGASGSTLDNITFRDFSVSFAGTVTQRLGPVLHGIYVWGDSGVSNTKIQYCTVENCEAYNCGLGINGTNSVYDTKFINNYVHDTLADGVSVYGYTKPCYRVIISGNTCLNNGDDAVSDNTYSSSSGPNVGVILSGNTVLNSGAGGVASCGSDGAIISNNVINGTFLAGIRLQGGYGFATITSSLVLGNQISGVGSAPGGQSATGPIAAILIESDNVTKCDNVTVQGNIIAPSGGSTNMGPPICLFASGYPTAVGMCNNHIVSENRIVGPFVAVTGTYRIAPPSEGAAIYIDNGDNAQVLNNNISKSFGHGIYLGPRTNGPCIVDGNVIEAPNTSNTALRYGVNILGARVPYVGNNPVSSIGTLDSPLNINPTISPVTINNFGAAPFTNGASIVGQTGTGTSPKTWSLGGSGTVTTNTSAPFLRATVVTSIPTALIDVRNSDANIDIQMGATGNPTAAGQVYAVLSATGSGNWVGVDLFNGAIVMRQGNVGNTILSPGNLTTGPAASSQFDIMRAGNTLTVWYTTGGTRTLLNQAFVSSQFAGYLAGVQFAATGVGIASLSVQ